MDRVSRYGAAGVMRMPTRLHITWENDNTLKIDTDNGQQTRRLVFNKSVAPPAAKSLQGFSVAEWERPAAWAVAAVVVAAVAAGDRLHRPQQPARAAAAAPPAAPPARFGNLKVVTTQLSGGWLRRNGVPYSEDTTMTEFFDRFAAPTVTSGSSSRPIVNDPKYLAQEFVTSTHFRREPNGAKWDPTPCKPI